MTSDLIERLEPCPFCGWEAEIVSGGPGNHYIRCKGCRATSDDVAMDRAIVAWNRRYAIALSQAEQSEAVAWTSQRELRRVANWNAGRIYAGVDPEEGFDVPLVPASSLSTLRRERDEARAIVTEANNSLYGSQGYFHSLNGGPFDKYHLANGIEQSKAYGREQWARATAAEAELAKLREGLTVARNDVLAGKHSFKIADAIDVLLADASRALTQPNPAQAEENKP